MFGTYQLYGDKQSLSLAMLDRYRDAIVERVFGIVERSSAGIRPLNGTQRCA
jgi:hypothetical protein